MPSYKIVFFGTSDFAVPILRRLAKDARFELLAVITQPDRPVGRKAVLTSPPIKETAVALDIPVYQYENVKSEEAFEELKKLSADFYAVASFGQIIPQRILDIPKLGAINVHASLLPKYRGASPIAAALLAGEKETGVSIMLMDAKMDHGAVLASAVEAIKPDDTTTSLSKRLAELGAGMLPETMLGFAEKKITAKEQDHSQATFVKMLSRENGRIDWNATAKEIERAVRAYTPWPGCFFELDGKRVKILAASLGPESKSSVGTHEIIDQYPAIVCGDHSSLVLKEIQPEGKSAMHGDVYLNGAKNWK